MSDFVRPLKFKKMKDAFGFHLVKVYEGTEILKALIREAIKRQNKTQDSAFLTCAEEGKGKSYFTLTCADIWMQETGKEVKIQQIGRSVNEFLGNIATGKTHSFYTLDEGMELSSENTLTKKSKNFKRVFTIIRKKSNVYFICFINPLKIGTYFKEDRIRGLFFIKETGLVYYYSNSPKNPHLVQILEKWADNYETKSIRLFARFAPDLIFTFPDYNGKLKADYEARKDTNMDRELEEFKVFAQLESDEPDNVDKNKYMTIKEACDYLNITKPTIRILSTKGYITRININDKSYYDRSSLDVYMKERNKTYKKSLKPLVNA